MDDFIGIVVSQTGTPEAGERYVGTTHVAIQTAVDYCNNMGGGKVFIEKGTYDIQQPINLCSNIEIYGESFGTILKPSFPNEGDVGCLQAIGTSGAELENIYIHDLLIGNTVDTKVGQYGIYCSYVGKAQTTGLTTGDYSRYDATTVGADKENKIGAMIENCYIQNNSADGIYLTVSSNNSVKDNIVQDDNTGIYLVSSSNNSISGNTVQNNGDCGIYLNSASNNNTITSNTVQNNNNNGILSNTANNNTITSNTVQNNNRDGISLVSSSNNTVTGNTVQNNSSEGIYSAASCSCNSISGNTVQSNGSFGIDLVGSSFGCTCTGNTIQNNTGSGIRATNGTVHSNTIIGNTVQSNGDNGIWLNNTTHNHTIVGNILRSNQSINMKTTSANNNLINGNSYGSSSFAGTGNVTTENIQRA
jgi:parallel beta-helix repeat protein